GDAKRLHDRLEERAGRELESIDTSPPVVCLNEELKAAGKFCSPSTAVRIRPDHWPAFADTAWMEIGTVEENPSLKAMVDPLDQHRIGSKDEE
ncbi:MAG: hypothetical protein C4530_06475, partial [Desulfobacteraceae bacterium]